MAGVALVLYVVFLGMAFGVRGWQQYRRTGSTGFRGLGPDAGAAEWTGGTLIVVAVLAGLAGPVVRLAGLLPPLVDSTPVHVAGLVVALAGIGATLFAQRTMGTSWRVGVDPTESTELVTGGPFATVRNPVFSAMLVAALGFAMLVPNPVTLAALVTLVVAVQIQVRAVEEPYLVRTHGEAYRAYAARAGRFVPGVGRLA
jgi:protein-S-isoprenylcysteine O-methyltransferase Ste14